MTPDMTPESPRSPEQLIIIRRGMVTEDGVKWIGAAELHDAIVRLLDRNLAARIDGTVIDDLGDSIMNLLSELPRAAQD